MTREDLKNYKYLKMRIDNKLEEYQEYFARATKVTSTLSDMPKARNNSNDTVEEYIDSSQEIIELFKEDLKKQAEIEKQLRMMNNEKYHTALWLRYIIYPMERNPLEKTAGIMNYSYSEMCRVNGDALNEFDKYDEVSK